MKILLLTTHLRMGGVPIYVVTLASALKRLHHEVFVASSGGELVKRLEKNGITHLKVNIDTKSELDPKLIAGLYHLYWLVGENAIDIVHTHTRITQVMGEALSCLTGVVHISTCHGFFKKRIGRRMFGCWGKRVIAISDAVREHLVNDFGIPKSKVALIHNGIDLGSFKQIRSEEEKGLIKGRLGLGQGPVVGIIARLSPVKGHRFLIRAMRLVVEKIENAQLLIVGEGEEAPGLKDLTRELGLSKAVVFTSSIFDPPSVLSIMDVFVLPSVEEGLGLALLEALCCARPVIASDVGGIYSIVKDNVTGLLVPPKDPERLAKAILKLLEDRELAAVLAKNGQSFVYENFSLDDMALKIEGLYKEATRR
jgi:glycosyltransferase involved in cell wall biosynthesis